MGKVGFIFAHSQHSHISGFSNFPIICALKFLFYFIFFANSDPRHHCQPTKKKFTIDQIGQVLF